jgi:hypothetical protein
MGTDDDLLNSALHTSPQPRLALGDLRRLVLLCGIPFGLAAVLVVVQLVRPYGRPTNTVGRMLTALATGDAERLRSEERLGFRDRAEREIKARGEAEHRRILAIFDKEAQLGDREYRRIRRVVAQLGEKEFRRLSRDDQRTVREYSRRQFVADKGWAALADDDRKLLGGPEVLGDRAKLRARAITVGLATLPEETQALAEGVDLTAPETAKDRKLAKIVAQAERAGYAELEDALQSAESAARLELAKLSRAERERVENGSYVRWLIEAGLKAADEKTRSKATLAELVDDDSPEAWALRRRFGQKDLDAESRKQIEGVDYQQFIDGKKAFVEQAGIRLWGEHLREIFAAGCCTITKVRFLGESGRSLRRNATATVALELGPPPPPKPAAKRADKPAADAEATEAVHPAKRLLGQTIVLEHRWGTWAVTHFDAGSSDEPAALRHPEEAVKAALGSPGGVGTGAAGTVLFLSIGIVLVVIVLRRRTTPALAPFELAVGGATLGLAALQIAVEGQANLDDLWFTPLYLAMPIWVGLRRGAGSGFIAGFLSGLGLLVAATVAGVPGWASAGGDALLVGEKLLAALFLAGTGALAGWARWPAALSSMLPLTWLLFLAALDRGQLGSLTSYTHVLLAVAVTAGGLVLARLGLLAPVARLFSGAPDGDESTSASARARA